MMVMATDRLRQILHVGKLAALRGADEIRRNLVELGRLCRNAVGRGSFRGVLRVCSDLLGNLLVLGWIRLSNLRQRAYELSERRKLAVFGLRHNRRCASAV